MLKPIVSEPRLKRVIGDLLLTGCGIAFLYIFISILITGGYMAIEPSPVLLWAEIFMSALITGVGIWLYTGNMRG